MCSFVAVLHLCFMDRLYVIRGIPACMALIHGVCCITSIPFRHPLIGSKAEAVVMGGVEWQ
jgi:hypothetical protein